MPGKPRGVYRCARCGHQRASRYAPGMIHRVCPAAVGVPPSGGRLDRATLARRSPDQIARLRAICAACRMFAVDHCMLDEGCKCQRPAERLAKRLDDSSSRCELGWW
ncbi:MAG: hypothetical protein ACYC35_05175 [Pirellulales bacterium]